MPGKNFSDLAREAINLTKQGLELLMEVSELQQALKYLSNNESSVQAITEIVEKEKIAVSLIQQAIVIERNLMTKQHKEIALLLSSL